jgi:uncharacterized membrane protein
VTAVVCTSALLATVVLWYGFQNLGMPAVFQLYGWITIILTFVGLSSFVLGVGLLIFIFNWLVEVRKVLTAIERNTRAPNRP